MTKILIRKEIQTQQLVGSGPGERPSIAQLWAAARHGRGTTPGSKVGVGGRLAGLAGLAGKAGAMVATANQTAQAMQGGSLAAPLQAGVTYQGLDPTGKTMGRAIEGQAPAPVGVASSTVPANLPITQQAPIIQQAPITQQGSTGINVGGQNLGSAPVTQQPIPALSAPAVGQQTDPVQRNIIGAMNEQGQELDIHGQPIIDTVQSNLTGAMMHRAFTDTVINRVGPDMVYKMTPHQLGTLSAYMYLKVR